MNSKKLEALGQVLKQPTIKKLITECKKQAETAHAAYVESEQEEKAADKMVEATRYELGEIIRNSHDEAAYHKAHEKVEQIENSDEFKAHQAKAQAAKEEKGAATYNYKQAARALVYEIAAQLKAAGFTVADFAMGYHTVTAEKTRNVIRAAFDKLNITGERHEYCSDYIRVEVYNFNNYYTTASAGIYFEKDGSVKDYDKAAPQYKRISVAQIKRIIEKKEKAVARVKALADKLGVDFEDKSVESIKADYNFNF